MRKIFPAILLWAVASGIPLAAHADDQQGFTDKEVKIGAFGPFAGPAYLFGKIAMNGIQVVFDKANEGGGVNGRKLVLIREDDGCKAEGAISAVKKLTSDEKVFALIGGACSNSTLAVRSEIEKSGIPFILNSATADAITSPVVKNIYTSQVTASVESKAQLDYAISHGAKKIAVVAMKDAWGTARYEPFMKYVADKGITLAANVELPADSSDATVQALQLQAADADAVILILYPKPAAIMVRDSIKIGLNPTWIGQTTINDLKAFDGQVGIPGALDHFVTITSTKFDPSDPAIASWNARITKTFPGDEPSPFSMYGLGSAQVFVEALRRAGPDLTREKFLQALGSLKDFHSDAYFGPITCNDPTSHQCNQTPGWFAWKDSKLVTLN
ncbi:ABC transporter substrate-binding protein [Rhizobium sp. VS19-DR104.2]|uniref:ABC transporter substrate-binding protein n=1 Tax=unclassified Rhizobium TaxID=2613769 RepID=UPI001CC7E4DA|nr:MULTISPECIES: ABC transporter substrate-binding protein [unclassified Rhizobium]MBZ5762232.1 ABC transporter substrate-binding protein [Rhizobium sp. VS19-DR96]MBZ5768248.1 ABC transporter substrate-binding protein [Rhizobium sp. VS19-DR129.2]MBZ5775880.1 ABC transporter substrate-binding protein [Rhizobium sp. VS19-DRK62.2]MBZ5787099.1 ABC transporter substrate-binding protein [Rhizobium sp. VS19-DR121]MBZ5804173.1 ABC transporter substrate-binding protein [Rhizobium sp. VS19-DR181]